MALISSVTHSAYELALWKMEESEDELQSITSIHSIPAILSIHRRLEYLSVRAAALTLGIKPNEITYLESGKPILSDPKKHISISHTKGYAAVAISQIDLMGIDIEYKSERVLKIRNRFLHQEEDQWIKEQSPNKIIENQYLQLYWCAKEALFKALPFDGIDFKTELRICNFKLETTKGHFYAKEARFNQAFQLDYLIENDYTLTCGFLKGSK